ncbi:hypothetical protein R4Y45_05500 [Holzapfeliella sp. He02]|uniref:Uncharacterized protein n=1 Tax=Holzapfeliella saturejae TaxID=3082953 RepID=A0ABU8SI20_9LACO
MMQDYQYFDLIEQITRNDGSKYYEIANIMMNGRAEKAAIENLIKEVRIVQLNIPRSPSLVTYEQYINETYTFPEPELTEFEEWQKPEGKIKEAFETVLRSNNIN